VFFRAGSAAIACDAVVGDVEDQRPRRLHPYADLDRRRPVGVPPYVGQRLQDDPVQGRGHVGSRVERLGVEGQVDRGPRVVLYRILQRPPQPGRLRWSRPVRPQYADQLPHRGQRRGRGPLDLRVPLPDVPGTGLAGRDQLRGLGPDDDPGDVVGDQVV
jgi:hypothetical protein